ncbi:MAG: ankyrin repeat domain-containing protein, partial [Candidatus Micrarchaeota archaeon]|nr:ankyrin repeat domain-containing protein [Candidatus Micrarchaeota archaeon]
TGNNELVKLLILYKADVNAKDSLGWTALMYAADKGMLEIASQLLDAGANAGIEDKSGNTARTYALMSKSHDVAKLLEVHCKD